MNVIAFTTALGLGLASPLAFAASPDQDSSIGIGQDQGPVDHLESKSDANSTTPAGQISDLGQASAFVSQQEDRQLLADDFLGETVFNDRNERIGDINDLLFDDNGEIAAAVIGVGGFLGIGEKDVAVRFEALDIRLDENKDPIIVVNGTREMLEAAPDFKTLAQIQAEKVDSRLGLPLAPSVPNTAPIEQ